MTNAVGTVFCSSAESVKCITVKMDSPKKIDYLTIGRKFSDLITMIATPGDNSLLLLLIFLSPNFPTNFWRITWKIMEIQFRRNVLQCNREKLFTKSLPHAKFKSDEPKL